MILIKFYDSFKVNLSRLNSIRFLGCGICLTTFIIHKVFHLQKRGLIHPFHRGLNCAGLSREVRNVEQSSGGRCRGYMLFSRSGVVQPYLFRRNI